jgi:hypothetical protein
MNLRLVVLFFCVGLGGCAPQEPVLTPTEQTIKFVDELRPLFVGAWRIEQIQLSAERLKTVYNPLNIRKDTLLQDVATVTIGPAVERPYGDPRVLKLEGNLTFRTIAFPIRISLSPQQNGGITKGTLNLMTNFTELTTTTISPAQSTAIGYLQDVGLLTDNFSVDLVPGQPRMTWRGLNRGITSVSLSRP